MKYARKAIVAAIVGFIGSFTTALSDGDVTGPEIIVAVLTGVLAGFGTFQVTNEELPGGDGGA